MILINATLPGHSEIHSCLNDSPSLPIP